MQMSDVYIAWQTLIVQSIWIVHIWYIVQNIKRTYQNNRKFIYLNIFQ